jgi:hypothetical protein
MCLVVSGTSNFLGFVELQLVVTSSILNYVNKAEVCWKMCHDCGDFVSVGKEPAASMANLCRRIRKIAKMTCVFVMHDCLSFWLSMWHAFSPSWRIFMKFEDLTKIYGKNLSMKYLIHYMKTDVNL